MRINNDRLFPYPVLKEGNGNFISSKFNAEATYRHNDTEYEFELIISLNELNLISLIKKEEAVVLCHLECSRTKFRAVEKLKIGKNEFKINVESLDGKLELTIFIIAKKDLKNYYSKDFDSDYGNTSFSIQNGSILAVAEIPSVFIENKKENNANLPSIFDISYSLYDRFMSVVLNGDRIKIILPLEEYQIRNAHKNSLYSRNIMNTMIVLPALISVLNDLSHKDSISTYGNKRWFGILNKKLLAKEINLENGDLEDVRIFTLAQELLEDLFSEAMDSLNYLEDSENESVLF